MIVTRRRLKPPAPLLLSLPAPPPPHASRAVCQERFGQWRERAERALATQRKGRFSGAVVIDIVIEQTKRPAGIEHRIAPVLALLVTQGMIPASDSSVVRKISASWGDVPGCEVTIGCAP